MSRARNRGKSIAGLFWLLTPEQQAERIRALSQMFNAETISTITRTPVSAVVAIIEGAR